MIIYTVGIARSGNTWLGRMLKDLLPNFTVKKSHNNHGNLMKEIADLKPGTETKIIALWRDPRDVIVSQLYYYKHQNLGAAIAYLAHPSYESFYYGWKTSKDVAYTVTYEGLKFNAASRLLTVYTLVTGDSADLNHIEAVVNSHKFGNEIGIGSRMARKGIVGDWKNHFTRDHAKAFAGVFNDILLDLGYERDPEWWRRVPKQLTPVAQSGRAVDF